MEALTDWVANANDAIELQLVGKDQNEKPLSFHPKFTYPIYGDAESIYGYKDLSLKVIFDATTLLPHVEMTFSEELPIKENEANENEKEEEDEDEEGEEEEEKTDAKENTEDDIASNPIEQLQKFMPQLPDTFEKWNAARAREVPDIFESLGEPISEFSSANEDYVLYKTTVKESLTLHQRMKLFVLLFIEAGSYIDETDDRWELYLVYRKRDKVFAGFSTVYQYMWYANHVQHDASIKSLDAIRKRISQFVILPPFQSLGIGSRLYSLLMDEFLKDDNVKEITVEDPSEAFDDLRDRCDLERLAKAGVWTELVLPADPEWLEKNRTQQKLAPRQFDRCVEMAALNNLGKKHNNKKYRLAVKKRVYIRNREALQELDTAQRFDKLQETYMRLVEDYERIIKKVDFSSDRKGKKRAAEHEDEL